MLPACERGYREWLFPLFLALMLLALGTLLYLYAASLADSHVRFLGRVDRNPENTNIYWMFTKQAMDGRFLLENRMTAEPLPPAYINFEWWLLGSIGRWLRLSQGALHQLERVPSVLLLTFAAYGLCAACLKTVGQRRFAAALICFGSGLGWLVWLCARIAGSRITLLTFTIHGNEARFPPDISCINVFHHALAFPHADRALAAAMAFGAFLIHGQRTGRLRWFVLAGLALTLRFTIRPYEIPESYLLLAAFPALLMLRSRRFSLRQAVPYALTGLIALPMLAYNAYLVYAEPLGRIEIDSPPYPPVNLILWQGIPLIAALVWCSGFRYLRRTEPSTLFLSLWLIIPFLLCYSYPYFRTGLEGLGAFNYVPVVLATQGAFAALYRWLRNRLERSPVAWLKDNHRAVLVMVPALFILFSSISGVASACRNAKIISSRDDRWFMDRDQYTALQWLDGHAAPSSVVLSLAPAGNWVPSLTRCKTVVGNWMFTPNFTSKAEVADRFFGRRGEDAFKRRLVLLEHVDYVLYGPHERALAGQQGFRPEDHSWLVPVFRSGETTVFAVQDPL